MMSEPSRPPMSPTGDVMSSAAGSPARTSVLPDAGPESTANDPGCGESSPGSFVWFDPDSSSWKTFQRCFFEGWVTFSGTWPASGLMLNGVCFPRVPLVRHTHERECFSLPTLIVATCEHPGRIKQKPHQQTFLTIVLASRDNWQDGGQLNPNHAAWLMGFPVSWTDLDLTETPSSPKSPSGSGDESSKPTAESESV